MTRQLVRWFNVMLSIILPLEVIFRSAFARLDKIVSAPETETVFKPYLSMTPKQKNDVLVLVALASLTAGLLPEFALDYAIKVVSAGKGITPYLQYLQKLVHVGFKGMDFDVRPDSSLDEFVNALAASSPEAAEAIRVGRPMMRDAQLKPFNQHRRDVAEMITNYLDEQASPEELAQIQVEMVTLVQDAASSTYQSPTVSINIHDMGVVVDGDGLMDNVIMTMRQNGKGRIQ